MLDEVVVSASRSEQQAFDAPGSIDVVGRSRIESSGPQVNISEALGLVPGINVANRSNYAQDLQVSIRGFGSRAPFGVRGVRLMIDGLPQTLPDGQGQTSQFAATSTDRIEVLRGPIAALYGNASGGLIQSFTRDPSATPELQVGFFAGSEDLYRSSLQYSETRGNVGLVVDYGALSSVGFRQYSAAQRDHLNAKLVVANESGKTAYIVNVLDQKKGEDPGSQTLANFQSTPYKADSSNFSYKAGKTFLQTLTGVVDDRDLGGASTLQTRAFFGSRQLDNPGRTASPYILVDRVQAGVGATFAMDTILMGTPGRLRLGFEAEKVSDARTARTNSNGVPSGAISRDEDNIATSQGVFVQSNWSLSDQWSALAGLRASLVTLSVKDYYLSDGRDGSGSRTQFGLSPVLGLTRHISQFTNLYINVGRSFETPTLNEVIYKESGGASVNSFNGGLSAARSSQIELGVKSKLAAGSGVSAAVFYTETKDDIVPLRVSSSSATWQNADTKRQGFELGGYAQIGGGLRASASVSLVQGIYAERVSILGDVQTAPSGNRLAGIPNDRLSFELVWGDAKPRKSGGVASELGLEFTSVGKIYANSSNAESTSRYSLVNLRSAVSYPIWGGALKGVARIDNLSDRVYAGSIIGDQESKRYYEPGAPRSYLLGIQFTRPI